MEGVTLMIELIGITKMYGAAAAVRDLSFRAPEGQIVGLLGQNGAGKTTTLNILTGYLPPTAGSVKIGGVDMLSQPRACKRNIGYLPERPPLYDEMTVRDFLAFVCELREVQRREIRAHVESIMSLCGLTEVAGRLCGHLSKGYRQRVGVAQALCGDPPVIVLDEPTVGLDPRQVVEIRELIRRLGEEHTVIFSSHILAEIQQLCQRVVILHKGRVVHEADLRETGSADRPVRLRASIAGEAETLLPALRSLPCVRRVQHLPQRVPGVTEVRLECGPGSEEAGDPPTQLFRLLCGLDAPLKELRPETESLEEIFLRATSEEEVTAP